jgi:hypothetical protein
MRLELGPAACDLCYLGNRYQEDCGSRPAQAKKFESPISTNKTECGGGDLSSQLHMRHKKEVLADPGDKLRTLF